MNQPLRILFVGESAVDADLIGATLERASVRAKLVRVASRDDFVLAIARFKPHLVLSDHSLRDFNSIAALEILRDMRRAMPLIVFAPALDEHAAVACLRAGAEDLVLKAHAMRLPSAIDAAIRAHRGVERLTPRQLQVMRLIAEGNSNRAIALRLRISVKTVESHRTRIMRRIGVHDVAHLVGVAIRSGLIAQVD